MLPQLRMEQTYAQIGLQWEKGVHEIRQPQAELNMRQEPAVLEIKQSLGTLTMDASESRANMDLKGILRRTREYASLGRQKALEAIAKISQEGDRLRAIENKGNVIAQLAFENSALYEKTRVLSGNWTTDGIEISYQKKDPEIRWQMKGMKMDPVINPPEIDYTYGKVNVYLRQKNSLSIDVVGGNLDRGM